MSTRVTCDEVFDVLTRGPFPVGSSEDASVEHHLAACHECRQLAEALRPAVGLFHESLEPPADSRLPSYHGSLEDLRSPRMPWNRPRRRRGLPQGIGRLVAAAACLLLCCGVAFGVGKWSHLDPGAGALSPVIAADGVGLGAAKVAIPLCTSHSRHAGQCCTECHAAQRPNQLPSTSILAMARHCQQCHREGLNPAVDAHAEAS